MLDEALCKQNSYYNDLHVGTLLGTSHVKPVAPGTFHKYMQAEDKLGGQKKVVRLANDRTVAENILAHNA